MDDRTENSIVDCEISLASNKFSRKYLTDGILVVNTRKSKLSATSCEYFNQNVHGLSRIPKHITIFDERYALLCLELIRDYAMTEATSDLSMKQDVLCDDLSNLSRSRSRLLNGIIKLGVEYPAVFRPKVIIDWSGERILSSVAPRQSVIHISKVPSIQEIASLDSDVDFRQASLLKTNDSVASHNVLISKSSRVHERIASISSSSSNSISSRCSCATLSAMYQGMLQYNLKDGKPQYVFNVDDRNEVYTANLIEVESIGDKGLDYVYIFRSRKDVKNNKSGELDCRTLGNMQVSSSLTICPDNSEILETQFLLSLSNDPHQGEFGTSNLSLKKSKPLLPKKVRSVLRPRLSYNYKHLSHSKFAPSDAILEDTFSDPSIEKDGLDMCDGWTENKYPPNFESAAIVVKDYHFNDNKIADHGGWGLKYLKNSVNKTSTPTKHARKSLECSTTIDIIIPAGFHGGPRTEKGDPSGLIERWKSGGRCDCGGWDTGCPLTILRPKSSYPDTSSTENSQECNSTDLFIQGSKQNLPIMKMVNIHDGLSYIHSQSTLSALQSFGIATAIVHSRRPAFRSRLYRS